MGTDPTNITDWFYPVTGEPNPETNDGDGLATGAIIGIAVGAAVGIIILFIILIVATASCRKNQTCCFAPRQKATKAKSAQQGVALTVTDSDSTNSNSSGNKSGTTEGRSAIDLIEITDHGEKLPDGWTKQRHMQTGEEFYVHSDRMISQKTSPLRGPCEDVASLW